MSQTWLESIAVLPGGAEKKMQNSTGQKRGGTEKLQNFMALGMNFQLVLRQNI